MGFMSFKFSCRSPVQIAESFYYVNYGSSISMSKVSQIILGMKTKTLVFITEIIWQTFDVIIDDP